MQLPVQLQEILQADNPLRPWALALAACVIACLPPKTRRVGGIFLCVLGGVAGVSFFIQSVYHSFLPTP